MLPRWRKKKIHQYQSERFSWQHRKARTFQAWGRTHVTLNNGGKARCLWMCRRYQNQTIHYKEQPLFTHHKATVRTGGNSSFVTPHAPGQAVGDGHMQLSASHTKSSSYPRHMNFLDHLLDLSTSPIKHIQRLSWHIFQGRESKNWPDADIS